MPELHPELTRARFIPRFRIGRWSVWLLQHFPVPTPTPPDDLQIENVLVPGRDGGPDVRLRLYRPAGQSGAAPALFWIHGGGFVQGHPEQDERTCIRFARELGITVASLQYRLAPQHPHPAAVEDAYAGLRWLFDSAGARGIDQARIAVGGASAGGGLAAGLVLLAHDRGEVQPVFQLLVYPMLDDRTVLRNDLTDVNARLWTQQNNRYGWTSYLGRPPGSLGIAAYAAPARRDDLAGLPPAWIGVGTNDLFHDEDVRYAQRLNDSGVPCVLAVVPGAVHGFDVVFGKTQVARQFAQAQLAALRAALTLDEPGPSPDHLTS